jgi:predicted RNA binding protein YcfA (HicA-like mRNA interferase family)
MSHTYDQFRRVLSKLGFTVVRSKKHETWRKKLPNGREYTVRISHQHGKDIPQWLFAKMLRQAGLTRDEFERLLRDP